MKRWFALPFALASACASFHPNTINDVEVSLHVEEDPPMQCSEVGFVTCDMVWWSAAECPALMTRAAKRAGATHMKLVDVGVGAARTCEEAS